MRNGYHSNKRRRVIRLYEYHSELCGGNFFESNGPLYVIEPLFENFDNRELLNEGLGVGLAKDALQFIVAGAAEYGLGAVTMPAAGAGAAVGPAVETSIDSVFAADSVAGALTAVKNVASSVGEFAKLFNEVMSNARGCVEKPQEFYDNVKTLIKKGLKILGKKAGEGVEKIAEKLKEVVEKLIDKLVDAVTSGVKFLIPDASAGAAVSSTLRTVLSQASQNSYSMLTSGVDKLGDKVKGFLSDSEKTKEFFGDLIEQLAEKCSGFAEILEKTSYAKVVYKGAKIAGAGGAAGAAAIKKFGTKGLIKLSGFIKSKKSVMVSLISNILDVVIPATYAALAIFQILMKGEFKEESEEGNKEKEGEDKEAGKKEEKKEEKKEKESSQKKESIIRVDRWQKMAGII